MFYITPKRYLKMHFPHYKNINLPKTFCICFNAKIINQFKKNVKIQELKYSFFKKHATRKFYTAKVDNKLFGIVNIDIGAPLLAFVIELLKEFGARNFIVITTAGSLDKNLLAGQPFIIKKAYSNNGLIKLYSYKNSRFYPSQKLLKIILQNDGYNKHPMQEVTALSIDAFFRESFAHIEKYKKLGVNIIEMEAASAFAIAKVNRLNICCIGYISDLLQNDKWIYLNDKKIIDKSLSILSDSVINLIRDNHDL